MSQERLLLKLPTSARVVSADARLSLPLAHIMHTHNCHAYSRGAQGTALQLYCSQLQSSCSCTFSVIHSQSMQPPHCRTQRSHRRLDQSAYPALCTVISLSVQQSMFPQIFTAICSGSPVHSLPRGLTLSWCGSFDRF